MESAKLPTKAHKIMTVSLVGYDEDRLEIEEFFQEFKFRRGETMKDYILDGMRAARGRMRRRRAS